LTSVRAEAVPVEVELNLFSQRPNPTWSLAAPQAERIIRLETKVDGITGSLAEIKTLVSRRMDGRP